MEERGHPVFAGSYHNLRLFVALIGMDKNRQSNIVFLEIHISAI